MATDIFTILPDDFPPLRPGDAYRFACTRCGECCFDQLVLLEPQDMLGLERHLALSAEAIFAAGIVKMQFIKGRAHAVLAQTPFGRGFRCHFVAPEMKGDQVQRFGCELHAGGNKPLVCRLSPIAISDAGFHLVAPIQDCPGMNKGAPKPLELSAEAEALALSTLFHQEIEPRFAHDTKQLQRAFLFDATDLPGLADYLRALL